MLTAFQQQNLDVAALAAASVVCVQTLWIFAARFARTPVPMHFTGAVSGLVGLTYCVFRLTYWSVGSSSAVSCTSLLVAGGILQNGSIALALVHLQLRAEAANHLHPQWKYWRWVGIAAQVLNIAAFAAYLALRSVTEYDGRDGLRRCQFNLSPEGLRIKYVAQTVNHVVQTALFVYPLAQHVQTMTRTLEDSREWHHPGLAIYRNLALRALIGMLVATSFTMGVTICVAFYDQSVVIRQMIVPLSVLDMALTLGSIAYAIDTKLQTERRRSNSSGLLHEMRRRSSSSNSTVIRMQKQDLES